MTNEPRSLVLNATEAPGLPFAIPGATPGGVVAALSNIDAARGLVTTIIRLAPGARIPARMRARKAAAC